MTLRHIEFFIAICENGCNTTKAAQQLHAAQPAVSLALRELEASYGVKLFDRIGKRLSITQAGKRFYEHAKNISLSFRTLEAEMRGWDGGRLRAGASLTIGARFLPGYVKAFRQEYPATHVQALVFPTEILEQKILENELDLALIEGIPASPSLCAQSYMLDALTVICPPDSAYEAGSEIDINEFRRQKFLLRERGSGTREVFEREIARAGFSVVPEWEAMSTTALLNAAENGLGLAVLPRRLVSEAIAEGRVKEISVKGLRFERNFSIIRHKEKYVSASMKNFIRLVMRLSGDMPS